MARWQSRFHACQSAPSSLDGVGRGCESVCRYHHKHGNVDDRMASRRIEKRLAEEHNYPTSHSRGRLRCNGASDAEAWFIETTTYREKTSLSAPTPTADGRSPESTAQPGSFKLASASSVRRLRSTACVIPSPPRLRLKQEGYLTCASPSAALWWLTYTRPSVEWAAGAAGAPVRASIVARGSDGGDKVVADQWANCLTIAGP